MKDLNKVHIIGRLTRDPELRETPSGKTVASISVATNFSWRDTSGNSQEKAEFHNIVVWGKLAEITGKYLAKGARVYFEGRLQTQSWEGDDGVKRYKTEIVASDMIMLDSRGSSSTNTETQEQGAQQTPAKAEEADVAIEDVPF